MNVAFVPLEEVSDKAHDIYEKAKSYVAEVLKEKSDLPGLEEQLTIQLERLRPGKGQTGPGCEFIMSPGMPFAPGKTSKSLSCFYYLLMFELGPTPPGKKYICVAGGLNHLFSRGSMVYRIPIACTAR